MLPQALLHTASPLSSSSGALTQLPRVVWRAGHARGLSAAAPAPKSPFKHRDAPWPTLNHDVKTKDVVSLTPWLKGGESVHDYVTRLLPSLRYDGPETFLASPTARTAAIKAKVDELMAEEQRNGGVLKMDGSTISTITAFPPGYIDKDREIIVGLQTDEPLKRAIKPQGGWRQPAQALEAHGGSLDPKVKEIYTKYRKTHNEAVFQLYTPEIRAARSNKLLTGLPDAYGRGRIIGDYRRVALFGVDALTAGKQADKEAMDSAIFSEDVMRLREEVSDQIKALKELKQMAASYGFDISRPATNAAEAVQWLYFGYLAAIKEQDGAAMSLGRVDSFLDSFIERDLAAGKLTEADAQELIDDFVLKLRMARHLRTPDYDSLFAGDPTWVTAVVGGMANDGEHAVTKTSYRILQTLYNLGNSAEPNITVLWSPRLPEAWKRFCSRVSINTCALQYESDDLMRPRFGDDCGAPDRALAGGAAPLPRRHGALRLVDVLDGEGVCTEPERDSPLSRQV